MKWIRSHGAVIAVAAACVALHLMLEGMLASPDWRRSALWIGGGMAFFVPVFREGDFLYPGQRFAMLVTHGFRHTGWLHLAVNMGMLLPLGVMLVRRVGQAGFLVAYVVTMVAAAVLYGLFTAKAGMMAGASGGIHGLAGVLAGLVLRDGRALGAVAVLAPVAAINAVFWVMLDGRFAWELHLAGVAVGLMIGAMWPPAKQNAAP
jgi:rhomboid protease GluP